MSVARSLPVDVVLGWPQTLTVKQHPYRWIAKGDSFFFTTSTRWTDVHVPEIRRLVNTGSIPRLLPDALLIIPAAGPTPLARCLES